MPVTAVAVLLAVTIVGENAWAEPLVWLPVSAVAGIVGERVRHGDELRRALIEELRRGLVGLYSDPRVGPLNVISRYIPAVSAQRIAGDFYGAVLQPTGDVATMVGDVGRATARPPRHSRPASEQCGAGWPSPASRTARRCAP